MKDTCYIIVDGKQFVKATKTQGVLQPGQLRLKVNFDIPNEYFTTPMFEATLTVPKGLTDKKVIEFEFELKRLKTLDEVEVNKP